MNPYPTWITPTHELYCQAPGCTSKDSALAASMLPDGIHEPVARITTGDTDLCTYHHGQFPKVVADLADMVDTLRAASYSKTKRGGEASVQVSGVQDVGAYWNPHAATVLAELTDWTGYLVRLIAREKPLPEPEWVWVPRVHAEWNADGERVESIEHEAVLVQESSHGFTDSDTVRQQLVAIAKHHAHWLSAYPFVGPFLLADAIKHRRLGMQAIDAPSVKKVELQRSHCREYIGDTAAGPMVCGAPLYAILRQADEDGTPMAGMEPSQILCSANPRHQQLPRDRWREYLDDQSLTV